MRTLKISVLALFAALSFSGVGHAADNCDPVGELLVLKTAQLQNMVTLFNKETELLAVIAKPEKYGPGVAVRNEAWGRLQQLRNEAADRHNQLLKESQEKINACENK